MPRSYNVLFLCTGNSARSILAEAITTHWGKGAFTGFSAGSHPRGTVHPFALDLLRELGMPTARLRSKSWDEFAAPHAPKMDFIFTVCDSAAGESCPAWPGKPTTAHWGMPDPAALVASEVMQRLSFRQTFAGLENRIRALMSLPFRSLDAMTLQARLESIGRSAADSTAA